MPDSLCITNCRLYTEPDSEQRYQILIKAGKIQKIEIAENTCDASREIDAAGRILSPGFIDLHIHGAGGVDTLAGTDSSISTMSQTLAKFGTTGYLATATVLPQKMHTYLPKIAKATQRDLGGATIFGIHLEGPFVNPKRRGGLFPEGIYKPTDEALDELLKLTDSTLRMMTIAPELDSNHRIIKRLLELDVIPSFGHSDASYDQTKAAFDIGVNHVTHLYNAMPGLHHRNPGPLLAIFENDQVTAQLISDGIHVSSDMVRWTYHMLGPERCSCITDGMQAVGLPEGRYLYNNREYETKNGAARYLDGTLIGTALSVGQIMKRFQEFSGCTLEEAINTASLVPAKVLGLDDKKGSIAQGKDGDLVLLDEDFTVWKTLVNGKVVYEK